MSTRRSPYSREDTAVVCTIKSILRDMKKRGAHYERKLSDSVVNKIAWTSIVEDGYARFEYDEAHGGAGRGWYLNLEKESIQRWIQEVNDEPKDYRPQTRSQAGVYNHGRRTNRRSKD